MVMQYLSEFNHYQNNFNGTVLQLYVQEHTEIPIFVVGLYLVLVFYVPELLQQQKEEGKRGGYNTTNYLRPLFIFWNFLLAVFSIAGACYTIPVLLQKLLTHGWRYTICQRPDDDYYHNGAVGFWAAAFILSKMPELMDTVFLILQKKPVIFLHWFHHCTVMLYCWHAYSVGRIGAGLWFAAMNYGVHAIMYSYYFLMCFPAGKRFVRPFAVYITSLQILQMVMGMIVNLSSAYYFDPADPSSCAVNKSNMRMGLMMYASYFVLFASLFKKLYLKKKKQQHGTTTNAHSRVQKENHYRQEPEEEQDDDDCTVCKTTTIDAHAELIGATFTADDHMKVSLGKKLD